VACKTLIATLAVADCPLFVLEQSNVNVPLAVKFPVETLLPVSKVLKTVPFGLLTEAVVEFVQDHVKYEGVPYVTGFGKAEIEAPIFVGVYESPTAVVFPAVTLNDEAGEYTGPV
jgi:hypothetical protein